MTFNTIRVHLNARKKNNKLNIQLIYAIRLYLHFNTSQHIGLLNSDLILPHKAFPSDVSKREKKITDNFFANKLIQKKKKYQL